MGMVVCSFCAGVDGIHKTGCPTKDPDDNSIVWLQWNLGFDEGCTNPFLVPDPSDHPSRKLGIEAGKQAREIGKAS